MPCKWKGYSGGKDTGWRGNESRLKNIRYARGKNWNDRIDSIEASNECVALVVYEDTEYKGRNLVLGSRGYSSGNNDSWNLEGINRGTGDWKDDISSVRVISNPSDINEYMPSNDRNKYYEKWCNKDKKGRINDNIEGGTTCAKRFPEIANEICKKTENTRFEISKDGENVPCWKIKRDANGLDMLKKDCAPNFKLDDDYCTETNLGKKNYEELANKFCRDNPEHIDCGCYNAINYQSVCVDTNENIPAKTYSNVSVDSSCPDGYTEETRQYSNLTLKFPGAGCIGRADNGNAMNYPDDTNPSRNRCDRNNDWQKVIYDPATKQIKLKQKYQYDGELKEVCLDHDFASGNRVHWHKCHGGNNQKWVMDEKNRLQTVRGIENNDNMCLAKDRNTREKKKFIMATCSDNENRIFKERITDKVCSAPGNYKDLPGCGVKNVIDRMKKTAGEKRTSNMFKQGGAGCLTNYCSPTATSYKPQELTCSSVYQFCDIKTDVGGAVIDSKVTQTCNFSEPKSTNGSPIVDDSDKATLTTTPTGDTTTPTGDTGADDKKPKNNTTLYIMIFGAIVSLIMMILLFVVVF